MALHCEQRVENANTMERKKEKNFMAHQTIIQFCKNKYMPLQKLAQKM
jgi:hypothetical protein